jgi:N-acetylneuraminic acid mutarotase
MKMRKIKFDDLKVGDIIRVEDGFEWNPKTENWDKQRFTNAIVIKKSRTIFHNHPKVVVRGFFVDKYSFSKTFTKAVFIGCENDEFEVML